jgi:hypothetical protein
MLKLDMVNLKSGYENLSDESKNYIYEHSENDVLIAAMVERYAVIINKYGYDNFLTDALGNPVLMALNSRMVSIYSVAKRPSPSR